MVGAISCSTSWHGRQYPPEVSSPSQSSGREQQVVGAAALQEGSTVGEPNFGAVCWYCYGLLPCCSIAQGV